MEYKEGDIVRVVLYKQPDLNENILKENTCYPPITEKEMEVILNGLIVNRVSENEYIVAYVVDKKIIQQSMIL